MPAIKGAVKMQTAEKETLTRQGSPVKPKRDGERRQGIVNEEGVVIRDGSCDENFLQVRLEKAGKERQGYVSAALKTTTAGMEGLPVEQYVARSTTRSKSRQKTKEVPRSKA